MKRDIERDREGERERERKQQIQKERGRHGDKEIKGSSTNFPHIVYRNILMPYDSKILIDK